MTMHIDAHKQYVCHTLRKAGTHLYVGTQLRRVMTWSGPRSGCCSMRLHIKQSLSDEGVREKEGVKSSE